MTTQEKRLNLLEEKVIAERNYLESQYQNWEKMVEGNSSFRERLERGKMSEYLKEAKRFVNVSEIQR